jgi:hypothetical protein
VPAEHGTLCGAIAELLTLIEDAEVGEEERPFVWARDKELSSRQAVKWVLDVTRRLNFTLPAVVLSVHYVSVLVAKRKVVFHATTWRALWFTAVTLADRVIEDDFMQEKFVRAVLRQANPLVTRDQFRDLQFRVLRWLEFKVEMDPEDYQSLCAHLQDQEGGLPLEVPVQRICVERHGTETEFTIADMYVSRPEKHEEEEEDVAVAGGVLLRSSGEMPKSRASSDQSTSAGSSEAGELEDLRAAARELCAARDLGAQALAGPDLLQVVHDLLGAFTPEEYCALGPLAFSHQIGDLDTVVQVVQEARSRRAE